MTYTLGLLGLGTVGTGVVQILQTPHQRHPLLKDIKLKRVGVRSPDKPRDVQLDPACLTSDLESIVTDPDIQIVVEVLGGLEPSRTLILNAIAQGKHVVTANKAVIARYGEEIFAAAAEAGVYVLLEAAVGGGIPVLQPLKQCLGGNRIKRITGIVNGTTNFILSQMSQTQANFGDVLTIAQERGYAEADPSADVDGEDAADKIAILASIAFGEQVDRESVFCEGIRAITADDIRYADEWSFVVKLLAIASRCPDNPDELDLRVHPTLLPREHPLAGVNQVDNAVLIEGEPIGQVMFFGPGAGRGPTASAVVSDILNVAAALTTGVKLANPLLSSSYPRHASVKAIDAVSQRYYARILAADMPGVLGAIGHSFGDCGVSLESIVQKDRAGDTAEIVVLTHDVSERKFQQALTLIRSHPSISKVATVLRVLPEGTNS
ncbi:MAG: homoserine dehydrogenase [Cyanobacteria bacterium J06639_1]